mgnify:CR=1 FL=1
MGASNENGFLRHIVSLLGLLGVSSSALALDPMPVNRGSQIEFVPTLSIAQGYDDNVDQAPSGDERSSNVTRLTPDFLFRSQERANQYQFRYRPELLRYSHESDDNRVDHRATANARLTFDARNRLTLISSASRTKALLNDTNREAEESEGDINEQISVDATHRFGATDAPGALQFRLGHLWNRYANNLTTVETEEGRVGSNKQSKEYDSLRLGSTFFWQVAPKTRMFIEGRYTDFDYLWAPSTLGSTNMSALAGVTWLATGKTEGSFRIGRERKDFDEASQSDEAITRWQARLIWRPIERSEWVLVTQNSLEEGSESALGLVNERAIEQTSWSLNWRHQWDDRWRSDIGYSQVDRAYVADTGENAGREDELTTLSLGVQYRMRRWLEFGFEARFRENDSSIGEASSYEQGTYFLTTTISL